LPQSCNAQGRCVLLSQEFEGNVDHLVTGHGGVFMIETKHRGYKPADLSIRAGRDR